MLHRTERNLENIPVGALGIIALTGCEEMGQKVNDYIVKWRKEDGHVFKDDVVFTGYEKDNHLRAAGNYVRNGYYQEARTVLDGMEAGKRNARWYYYSACANAGLGNNVTAMEHARRAASMEPNNLEYRALVNQLEGNGNWYQQRQRNYESPYAAGGDWCMKMCMLSVACNICCGGSGFCCGSPYGI